MAEGTKHLGDLTLFSQASVESWIKTEASVTRTGTPVHADTTGERLACYAIVSAQYSVLLIKEEWERGGEKQQHRDSGIP